MKTLVINTYGGSLILGATALGCEVTGAYEDVGFGQPIPQANFPHLNYIALRKDWPAQDLSEAVVIAHPPCSAFSVQVNSPSHKGVDSDAFACTVSVLQYAMENKALAVAIESVVGALSGAWHVHQKFADEHGYHVYRILENGCMFGGQWRDRFWSVFVRKGAAPDLMPWTLTPHFQTVRQVVEGYTDGPSPAGLDEELVKLKKKFVDAAACSDEDLDFIFGPNPEELCSVDDRLWRRKFPDRERWDVCKEFVTKYASSAMVHLAPNGLAPVLLGSSWWYLDGRNLSERAYKRLMGFPADYVFPEGDTRKTNYRADMRTYLSKGVIPQIATWVLDQVTSHLGWTGQLPLSPNDNVEPYRLEILPNDVADFRIRKKTWGEARPELRHEVERLIPPASKSVMIKSEVQATAEPKQVRLPRPPRLKVSRHPSPWNAPALEEALRGTLVLREHTADEYALHESHGYHRMGVRSGDVVLDIGAHIGTVALRSVLVGAAKVICVEPEAGNLEMLRKNVGRFDNVEVLAGAVYGGEGDTVQLHTVQKRSDEGHSTGTHSVVFKTRGATVEVPRFDFKKLLATYQPTVVKCDCEGGELSLDWTDLPASVRTIGIELHTRRDQNRDRAKEIVAQLETAGFKPVNAVNMESNFSAIIAFFSREIQEVAA